MYGRRDLEKCLVNTYFMTISCIAPCFFFFLLATAHSFNLMNPEIMVYMKVCINLGTKKNNDSHNDSVFHRSC